MNTEFYDVFIYEKSTRKIDAIIGQRMRRWDGEGSNRHTADLRVETGKERINDKFECDMFPAGKYRVGDVIS